MTNLGKANKGVCSEALDNKTIRRGQSASSPDTRTRKIVIIVEIIIAFLNGG